MSVVSDSVRPHRRQPTRLPHSWDSPGKNTGVGCQFLLQCMKVKSENEVPQSCLTLSNLMDCSLPASSIHGIFQARVLEWVTIASSAISDLFHNLQSLVYCLVYRNMQNNGLSNDWLTVTELMWNFEFATLTIIRAFQMQVITSLDT